MAFHGHGIADDLLANFSGEAFPIVAAIDAVESGKDPDALESGLECDGQHHGAPSLVSLFPEVRLNFDKLGRAQRTELARHADAVESAYIVDAAGIGVDGGFLALRPHQEVFGIEQAFEDGFRGCVDVNAVGDEVVHQFAYRFSGAVFSEIAREIGKSLGRLPGRFPDGFPLFTSFS